jgi:cytochrome c biogenesis protein CcmG, thiol:disulfide interchange protein DsbE
MRAVVARASRSSFNPRNWTRGERMLALALLPLAAVITLLLILAKGSPSGSQPMTTGPRIGFTRVDRPAPSITLPSLTGKGSISLADLAGEPIVINFWSTTCDICRSETPVLVQVAHSTAGRVRFLGIDTLDSRQAAQAFAAKYQIPYRLSFDSTETVGARYGLPGLPMTFFLSPSGSRILGVNVGALTRRSLLGILHELYHVA